MRDFREQNFYELLDVQAHCNQEELERAYQRARRFFSPDSVATYALFQPDELNLLRRRIEEAFRTLSEPIKRRAYDQDLARLEGDWIQVRPISEEGPAAVQATAPAPSETDAGTPAAPTDVLDDGPPPEEDFTPPAEAAEPAAEEAPEPGASVEEEFDEERVLAAVRGAFDGLDLGPPLAVQGRDSDPPKDVAPESDMAAAEAEGGPVNALAEELPLETAGGQEPPLAAAPLPPELPAATGYRTPQALDSEPPACRPPMPGVDGDTEVTGALLKQARMAMGMSLDDLVQVTKISIYYLRNIENEDYTDLPALVYVRGYLRQLAQIYKMDAQQVSLSYLARLESRKDQS